MSLKRTHGRRSFVALALAIGAVASTCAFAERQPSAIAPQSPKAAMASESLNAGLPMQPLVLDAVPSETIQSIHLKNAAGRAQALQIGIVRDLPARPETRSAALAWHEVPEGMALQWRVRATHARALRVRLDVRHAVPGARVRFASNRDPSQATGQPLPASGAVWGPVIGGDEAIVEIVVASAAAAAATDVAVVQVADHFASPLDKDFAAKSEWLAQPCETDLICESRSDPVLARAGTASIRITWVHDHGAYACSATLLNAADGSFRPYIFTAAHCLNEQAAASSLVSHWFYDKSTCGGDAARSDAVQVGGGARLLAADEQLDASFLELNQAPPAGVTFAGWDSDVPSAGEMAVALHHANGEVTKVSHGNVLLPPPYPFLSVAWTSSIVQGGSSGSGLFTRGGARGDDLLFRGGLSGAAASCTAPGNGLYSRLDRFWPRIAPYLSASAAHANATGLWWNPAEPGWGLTLNQQGDATFGVLYLHGDDGRPLWLVASDMRPQADGGLFGALYRTSRQPSDGRMVAETIGGLRVSLKTASEAELTYTVNGVTTSKSISRQVFARNAPVCVASGPDRASATNYQDLWWNRDEPGWGLAIAHQADVLFVTLFTYDEAGRSTWYVGSNVARRAEASYGGTLYRMAGPSTPVANGTIDLDFTDGQAGIATISIEGRTITRAIERQVFGASPPVCS